MSWTDKREKEGEEERGGQQKRRREESTVFVSRSEAEDRLSDCSERRPAPTMARSEARSQLSPSGWMGFQRRRPSRLAAPRRRPARHQVSQPAVSPSEPSHFEFDSGPRRCDIEAQVPVRTEHAVDPGRIVDPVWRRYRPDHRMLGVRTGRCAKLNQVAVESKSAGRIADGIRMGSTGCLCSDLL